MGKNRKKIQEANARRSQIADAWETSNAQLHALINRGANETEEAIKTASMDAFRMQRQNGNRNVLSTTLHASINLIKKKNYAHLIMDRAPWLCMPSKDKNRYYPTKHLQAIQAGSQANRGIIEGDGSWYI